MLNKNENKRTNFFEKKKKINSKIFFYKLRKINRI